jgi:hypothetical protein
VSSEESGRGSSIEAIDTPLKLIATVPHAG